MNAQTLPVSTWELLRALGFTEDEGKLRYKLDHMNLRASQVWNEWLAPVVSLSGVYQTSKTIGRVASDLLPNVESREQGLAFLAYYLEEYARHDPNAPPWLHEGRSYRHLLPWERKRTEYEARPHCYVQRDWARLALKKLAEQLAKLDDHSPVSFSFRGGVLTIRCVEGAVIAMSADGRSWAKEYYIKAGALRKLPKRLMRDTVGFAIWDSALTIGNLSFRRVIAAAAEASVTTEPGSAE